MKYLFIMLFLANSVFAQVKEEESGTLQEKHSLMILIGHTYISQGIIDGERAWLVLPSLSLDYNYSLSKTWSIGLHNDLILENFKVEKFNNESEIERNKPFTSALTAGLKHGEHFTYQIGLGGEFAVEGNLFLSRLGVEYNHELAEGWEFISNFIYDIKWRAYDSFSLGVGVSKSF